MLPETPPASSLVRSLGPTGLLGLAWTAAPAVCGTALLAGLGPLSEWLLYHRPLGLALYTVVFVLGAGLGFLPTYAQSILGGWVFGVAAGLCAALVGFTGGGLLGYQVARRVSKDRVERPHRGKPEGPRDPRRARRPGAVADPAGRHVSSGCRRTRPSRSPTS